MPPSKGEKVLLVRIETSPEDLRGMIAAEGILTARGGVSSHAALVARQMGKVCVCGAAGVADRLRQEDRHRRRPDLQGRRLPLASTAPPAPSTRGQIKTAPSEIIAGLVNGDKAAQKTEKFKSFVQLMKWCAQGHPLAVRTNADTPEQTAQRHRVRRRRHRPHPHRAHVLRGRPHRRDARDDPRRQRSKPARPPSRSSCPISARTSSASSRRSRASRPPSASSIRRCTSSSRTRKEQQMDLARKLGIPVEKIMPPRRTSSMSSTRCSVSAAAVSASPIRKSPRCRPAPSSRPPPTWRRRRSR